VTTNLALKAGRDIGYHTSRTGGGHAGGMAYYTGSAGDPPGVWAGRGAEKLGLSGAVDPEVIHRLSHEDITPDGERLAGKRVKGDSDVDMAVAAWQELHPFASGAEVDEYRASQRAKVNIKRPYFDFALGLVKSASVLHASLVVASKLAAKAGDMAEARRLAKDAEDIERAMMEVAVHLVGEIEATAAYTRTGHHSGRSGDHGSTGEWRDADGVIAALFLQHTSHEGDPHLHVHVTVQNRVQRADHADVKYRTLDSRTLYRERLRLAAIADREMEVRMTRLGWVMVKREDGNGSEVDGVDSKITRMFSSRRASITPELGAMIAEYKARHGHEPNDRARWLMSEHVSMKLRAGSKGVKLSAGELLDGWE
jgi:conjugative relaxase-like TrwC/TraI family protein